jgi:hypothetical protein
VLWYTRQFAAVLTAATWPVLVVVFKGGELPNKVVKDALLIVPAGWPGRLSPTSKTQPE